MRHYTVHLILQLEAFIKHISTNQLELIVYSLLLKSLPRTLYHAFRDIQPIYLLGTLLHQFLATWTESAPHLKEGLALDALFDNLLEHCVVGVMLHQDSFLAPQSISICG